MHTLAEFVMFAVGWFGIMGIIAVICWAVGKWGKNHPDKSQDTQLDKDEEAEATSGE